MELKKLKIYRFAYTNEISYIYVPEGVRFYCYNKDRTENSYHKYYDKELRLKVWNEHWIAVLPYTDENAKISHNNHWRISDGKTESHDDYPVVQSLSMHMYTIGNKYIIWDLPQIFPLDENWPEQDWLPLVEECYEKIRATQVTYDTEFITKVTDEAKYIENEVEKAEYIMNRLQPVAYWVKVYGLSKRPGGLDCTTITTASWLDGSEIHHIDRKDYEFELIDRKGDRFFDTYSTTKEEFDEVFNKEIDYIYNNESR